MAQKTITIILAILVIGGLAWYVNKTYLESTKSQNASQTGPLPALSGKATDRSKIIYVSRGNATEIWQAGLIDNGKAQKIFTDGDEVEKIIRVFNYAPLSREIFILTSAEADPYSANLGVINIVDSKKTVIQKNFNLPLTLSVSADGKQIAYTKFSNLEDNYGFTLYRRDRDGQNPREIVRSESEVLSPGWSPDSSKIAYVSTSGEDTEVHIVEFNSGKNEVAAKFPQKIIDNLIWSEAGIVLAVRGLSEGQKGAIELLANAAAPSKKLADFSGGRANFVYLLGDNLVYLIAQYQDKPDDKTAGQIYLLNVTRKQKTPLVKASQVIGLIGE